MKPVRIPSFILASLVALVSWAPPAWPQPGSSLSDAVVAIDLDEQFRAGDASAPVVLAVYACGRSDLCARSIPLLYEKVSTGQLKGRVKLYYRPFFTPGEDEAAQCGRALVAAASQGMFWPYLLTLYENNAKLKTCMLRRWAEVTGLDTCAYKLVFDDPKTSAYLLAVQQEAARNKVDTTPSVFINGRRVLGDPSVDGIIGLLDQELK